VALKMNDHETRSVLAGIMSGAAAICGTPRLGLGTLAGSPAVADSGGEKSQDSEEILMR
jgi:hypothetical protein